MSHSNGAGGPGGIGSPARTNRVAGEVQKNGDLAPAAFRRMTDGTVSPHDLVTAQRVVAKLERQGVTGDRLSDARSLVQAVRQQMGEQSVTRTAAENAKDTATLGRTAGGRALGGDEAGTLGGRALGGDEHVKKILRNMRS